MLLILNLIKFHALYYFFNIFLFYCKLKMFVDIFKLELNLTRSQKCGASPENRNNNFDNAV